MRVISVWLNFVWCVRCSTATAVLARCGCFFTLAPPRPPFTSTAGRLWPRSRIGRREAARVPLRGALEGSSGGGLHARGLHRIFHAVLHQLAPNGPASARRPARLGPRADYRGCSRQTSRLIWLALFSLWGRDALPVRREEERDQGRMRPLPSVYKGRPAPRSRKTRKYPGCRRRCRRCPRRSGADARAPRPTPSARKPPVQADAPVPPGFVKTVTRHFNVYAENRAASAAFLEPARKPHGNLMLDLAPSPHGRARKKFLFFSSPTAHLPSRHRPPGLVGRC